MVLEALHVDELVSGCNGVSLHMRCVCVMNVAQPCPCNFYLQAVADMRTACACKHTELQGRFPGHAFRLD